MSRPGDMRNVIWDEVRARSTTRSPARTSDTDFSDARVTFRRRLPTRWVERGLGASPPDATCSHRPSPFDNRMTTLIAAMMRVLGRSVPSASRYRPSDELSHDDQSDGSGYAMNPILLLRVRLAGQRREPLGMAPIHAGNDSARTGDGERKMLRSKKSLATRLEGMQSRTKGAAERWESERRKTAANTFTKSETRVSTRLWDTDKPENKKKRELKEAWGNTTGKYSERRDKSFGAWLDTAGVLEQDCGQPTMGPLDALAAALRRHRHSLRAWFPRDQHRHDGGHHALRSQPFRGSRVYHRHPGADEHDVLRPQGKEGVQWQAHLRALRQDVALRRRHLHPSVRAHPVPP